MNILAISSVSPTLIRQEILSNKNVRSQSCYCNRRPRVSYQAKYKLQLWSLKSHFFARESYNFH